MGVTSAAEIIKRGGDGLGALRAGDNDSIRGNATMKIVAKEQPVFRVPGRTAADVYARARPVGAGKPLAGAILRVYAEVEGQDFLMGLLMFSTTTARFEGPVARVRAGCDAIKVTIEGSRDASNVGPQAGDVDFAIYAYGVDPQPTEFVDLTTSSVADGVAASSLGGEAPRYESYGESLQYDGTHMLTPKGTTVRQLFGVNAGASAYLILAQSSGSTYVNGEAAPAVVVYVKSDENFAIDLREVNANQRSGKDGFRARPGRYLYLIVSAAVQYPSGMGTFTATPIGSNSFFVTAELRD